MSWNTSFPSSHNTFRNLRRRVNSRYGKEGEEHHERYTRVQRPTDEIRHAGQNHTRSAARLARVALVGVTVLTELVGLAALETLGFRDLNRFGSLFRMLEAFQPFGRFRMEACSFLN